MRIADLWVLAPSLFKALTCWVVMRKAPPLPLPPALGARVVSLADLALEPKSPDWAGGLRATWQRGEPGAQACLEQFLTGGLPGYAANRDRPDKPTTSRLSPYLRFGNISVRQVWHAAMAAMVSRPRVSASKTLRSSCRNSFGASSPIICSIIIQISRVAIFEHDSTSRLGGGIP